MRASGRRGYGSAEARVFVALLACASAAAAQPAEPERTIALVSPGAELERAARTALEPWSVQIVVVDEAVPGATAPRNSAAARALALAHGAAAVVWVSEQEQSHAIWVYDLDSDQLLARPISGPLPFDGPTAAAVALSVKTLLRHSATAPAAERYGATPEAALQTPGTTLPAPPAEPPAKSAAQPAPRMDAELAAGSPDGPEGARSPLDAELTGGVRFGLTRPSEAEARFGIGAWFFPDAGAFGVGLRGAIGPPLEVASPAFEGRLLDMAPGLFARYRQPLPSGFALAASAGATAHVTVLDGATRDRIEVQSVVRVGPSLDFELLAEVRLASFLRLGARGGVLFWLRPQRYLIGDETVLELHRTAFEAGLTLTAGIPN